MNNKLTKKEVIDHKFFFGCPNCGYPSFGYCWGNHLIAYRRKLALVCESCGWRTHWHRKEKSVLNEYGRKRLREIRKDIRYGNK